MEQHKLKCNIDSVVFEYDDLNYGFFHVKVEKEGDKVWLSIPNIDGADDALIIETEEQINNLAKYLKKLLKREFK